MKTKTVTTAATSATAALTGAPVAPKGKPKKSSDGKPAAKANPAPQPAAQPVAPPAVVPGATESGTTSLTPKGHYNESLRAMAPTVRYGLLTERALGRWTNGIMQDVGTWTNASDVLKAGLDVTVALGTFVAEMRKLGVDFKPAKTPRTAKAQAPLTVGEVVTVKEARAAQYEGVIDAAKGLVVVENRAAHVVVRDVSGVKAVIPRAHLQAAA